MQERKGEIFEKLMAKFFKFTVNPQITKTQHNPSKIIMKKICPTHIILT